MRALRVLVAVMFLSLGAAATGWAHPPRPTSRDQALHDGCQRSDFGLGFNTSPQWVYVYRNPTIRMARGLVRISHAALADSILQHRSFDFNANLVPDAPYRYLIAGSRSRGTNNYAPDGGEEFGRLHFEWESLTLPLWAWPTDGDRASLWGSWIWDCGHWTSTKNNIGGVVTGEHSELHPLNAIAVERRTPFRSALGASETDVFVSTEGDGAHAVEKCALSHHPAKGGSYPQYDSGFKPCAMNPRNRVQPLERSYRFFVPAPPRPSRDAVLHYRVENHLHFGSGGEQVKPEADGIAVTVKVPEVKHVVSYGKSFLVFWSVPPRHRPTTLKVRLKSLLIKQADPNPAVPDPSGAHWSLYLDVDGYWQLLNKWAPRLTKHVTDGERIAINRVVTLHVRRTARVWFQVAGRECDEPAGRTIAGIKTNVLYPCPRNTDEQNPSIFEVFKNDDPGTILDVYRSAAASLGSHTSTSAATVRWPGSGRTTLGNGVEGQGDYQLTYAITEVRHRRHHHGHRPRAHRHGPGFTG